MKLTEIWGYCILGCALGLMLGAFGPSYPIGDWYLDLGWCIPPVFVCVVSAYVILPRFSQRAVLISTGGIWGMLPHLATRPGMGRVVWEPIQNETITVSITCCLLTCVYLSLCGVLKNRQRKIGVDALLPNIFPVAIILAWVFLVVFRVTHEQTLHIPNEERSLMIGGVEIHHLNLGCLMLTVLIGLRSVGLRSWFRWVGVVLLGLGAGFYWDEWIYMALRDVSDQAYREYPSLIGGIFGIGLWWWLCHWWIVSAYAKPDKQSLRPRSFPSGAGWIIGHRGAKGCLDENTKEGVQFAHELGIKMVEIDVGRSKDGELFLMHDYSVKRTTNGQGLMSHLSSTEIEQLRTKNGYHVPKLSDILDSEAFEKLLIFVDMKGLVDTKEAITKWRDKSEQLIWDFQCFDEAFFVKSQLPEYRVVISPFLPFYLMETVHLCRVDGVDIYHQAYSERVLMRLQEWGHICTTWYTDDFEKAKRILNKGVDGLMSDRPDKLLTLCQSNKEE